MLRVGCVTALIWYIVGSQVSAQELKQDAVQVRLLSARPLRKGVQAFPLIAKDGNHEVERINASLVQHNDRVLEATHECDAHYSDWKQMMVDAGAAKPSDDSSGMWTRSVEVTMKGPRFVSYVARDSVFCGGAHPDDDTMALVYDLQTGTLVDWVAKLPPGSASDEQDSLSDGTMVPYLKSTTLVQMYLEKMRSQSDGDCSGTLSEESLQFGFTVWPDAKVGALAIQPSLPHVIQACGPAVYLKDNEMQRLGLSEDMREAITVAHRLSKK